MPAPITKITRSASLTFRALVIILSTLAFIAVVATAISAWRAQSRTAAALEARAVLLSEMQAQSISRPLYDFNSALVLNQLSALRQDSDFVAARVVGADKDVVAEIGTMPTDLTDAIKIDRDIVFTSSKENVPVGNLTAVFSRQALAAQLRSQVVEGAISLTLMLMAVTTAVMLAFRQVSIPLGAITIAVGRLANGDTEVELAETTRNDEIGDIARALVVFRNNAVARQDLEVAQAQEQAAKDHRHAAVEALAQDFNTSVHGVLQSVGAATRQLKGAAQSLSALADSTAGKAEAVASAAENAAGNVATVASATEEMTASEAEIAQQVSRSADVARLAVQEAERVNGVVAGLSEAAGRIGEIVRLINEIASRTNLLALNATIEAARAGDAGKGFAVVANEVKTLATQTAKATNEISVHISGMQTVSREAVEAIAAIGRVIGEINDSAVTITAAVTEQGAATREIARSIEFAAQGTTEVTHNIIEVKGDAAATGSSALQVLHTAELLSSEAESLTVEVHHFLSALNDAGNRRHFERRLADLAVTVEIAGRRVESRTVDLCPGGVRLRSALGAEYGTALTVTLPGYGKVPGRLAGRADGQDRIVFSLDGTSAEHLQKYVDSVAAA